MCKFRRLSFFVFLGLFVTLMVGCGKKYKLHKVTGTVKFSDKSIPQAEIATIRFEPAEGTKAEVAKAAQGEINKKDGSFELYTVKPGDGVFAGEYKVVFSIWKYYPPRESLVHSKYQTADNTPYTVTVKTNGKNNWNFKLDKP